MAKIATRAAKPRLAEEHPYEMIIILKSSILDEDAGKVVEKIKAAVEKGSGEIVRIDNVGRKKLAYEVRKEKKGLYFLIYFKGRGNLVLDVQRICRLDEAIIKFLTIRIKPSELPSAAAPTDILPEEKKAEPK
ncbi:MAG: 30S ribosomal protein S6 [Nitrospirota bacterium]